MEKKRLKTALFIPFAIVLLLFAIPYVLFRAYTAETVLIGPDRSSVAVYYEPEDPAAAAAANYLACAVEQALGVPLETVTRQEDGLRYISILSSSAEAEEMPAAEKLDLDRSFNPEEAGPVYSVSLEERGLVIRVPAREDCFSAVKAVADRWLSADCGLKRPGELGVSRFMVEKQLSGLSIELKHQLRILTQNLRYCDDKDGNSVAERAKRFEKLVSDNRPDIIGTQECTLQWLQLLRAAFSDSYEFFGCSRLGPNSDAEEWNAVLFRKDRFELLDGDTFWLSNTPGEAASKLNYDGCVRICTWVLLRDQETGKIFLFGNTHLQDGGTAFYQEVRARQAEVLFRQLRGTTNRLAQYPGFLTGDFNGEANEPFYSEVTGVYADARTVAVNNSSTADFSFHGYGQQQVLIDYCFCSPKNTTILDYQILDTQYGGYVSDHYGILITALLNG